MEPKSKASGRLTPDQQKEKALEWVKCNAKASDDARKQLNGILEAGPIHSSLLSDLRDKYGIPKPVSAWVKLWDEFTCYSGKKDSPVGQPAIALSVRRDDQSYWKNFRRTLAPGDDDSPWMKIGIPVAASVCGSVRMEIFCAFLRHLQEDPDKWLLMSDVCLEFIRISGMRFQDFFQGRKPGDVAKSPEGMKLCEWSFSDQRPPILRVRRRNALLRAPIQDLTTEELYFLRSEAVEKGPEQIYFKQIAHYLHLDVDSLYLGYLRVLNSVLTNRPLATDSIGDNHHDEPTDSVIQGIDTSAIDENLAHSISKRASISVAENIRRLGKFQQLMSHFRDNHGSLKRRLFYEREKIQSLYAQIAEIDRLIAEEPLYERFAGLITFTDPNEKDRERARALQREVSERLDHISKMEEDLDQMDRVYKKSREDLGVDKLLSELYGKRIKGKIARLAPSGARVDIDGVDAWLPLSEMSWDYVEKPCDAVSLNEEREFVLVPDKEDDGRLIVSIKRTVDDPWNTAVAKFPVGEMFTGVVARYSANDDGAVVTLAPGINGYLPLSEMPLAIRKQTASSSIEKGARVIVAVKSIIRDQRKMLLSMKQMLKPVKSVDAHPVEYYVRMLFGHDKPTIEDVWRLFYPDVARDNLTGSTADEFLHAYSEYLFSIVRCDDGRRFVVYVASQDPEAYALANIDVKKAHFSGWKNSHSEEGRWLKIAEIEDKEMISLLAQRNAVLSRSGSRSASVGY